MSYVYESFEPGLWTVGFYSPDGKFRPEGDYTDRIAAGQRVHFLNGGTSAALQRERDEYLGEANRRGKVLGEARDAFLKHDGDRIRYRAALTRIAADPHAGESAMIAREALEPTP
jgi:hypothetical protein